MEKEAQSDRESLRSVENLSSDLMKEKAQLQKTLETLRENSERQVHENDSRSLNLLSGFRFSFDNGINCSRNGSCWEMGVPKNIVAPPTMTSVLSDHGPTVFTVKCEFNSPFQRNMVMRKDEFSRNVRFRISFP